MSYVRADDVLPPELVKEIQKYVRGSLIYVSRPDEEKIGWGGRSGARVYFDRRNESIRQAKERGSTIRELARDFHLSEDGIRKVLYRSSTRERVGDLAVHRQELPQGIELSNALVGARAYDEREAG